MSLASSLPPLDFERFSQMSARRLEKQVAAMSFSIQRAEEAEEVVCAARAEMAELRADLDVSRGEQASSTRTGRDHTDRRERRETPLPPPSPAVPDPDPSP